MFGSTDKVLKELAELKENISVELGSINKGLDHIFGSYIFSLNSDDLNKAKSEIFNRISDVKDEVNACFEIVVNEQTRGAAELMKHLRKTAKDTDVSFYRLEKLMADESVKASQRIDEMSSKIDDMPTAEYMQGLMDDIPSVSCMQDLLNIFTKKIIDDVSHGLNSLCNQHVCDRQLIMNSIKKLDSDKGVTIPGSDTTKKDTTKKTPKKLTTNKAAKKTSPKDTPKDTPKKTAKKAAKKAAKKTTSKKTTSKKEK